MPAYKGINCLAAVPAKATIKHVSPKNKYVLYTPKRRNMWEAQTPQVFQTDLIRKAHRLALTMGYRGTDDADLVQKMGRPVWIVPGCRKNIKITTTDDLILAEALCNCCEL